MANFGDGGWKLKKRTGGSMDDFLPVRVSDLLRIRKQSRKETFTIRRRMAQMVEPNENVRKIA